MILLLILSCFIIQIHSFKRTGYIHRDNFSLRDSTLVTSILQRVNPDQARAEFFFFFFGGSGALGIGAAQVPKLIREFEAIKLLGGKTSLGGEVLDCSPIATIGYPEPLRVSDVQKIISNIPAVEKILAKGEKKTYLAQMGYVERKAFEDCLPGCNPLAIYAVFEAISGGGGAGVASPIDVVQKVKLWRESDGIGNFKNELLKSSIKKNLAFIVFAFLISVVLDLIIESGVNAFL